MSRFTIAPHTVKARLAVNLVLALVIGMLVTVLVIAHRSTAQADERVPQSSVVEAKTGVRFSRVAVVGDKGLVTLFYVVLDPERATAFQADRTHPPRLTSESRSGGTQRASIMRSGHSMRAGQTYYVVYQNTDGAIRSGEKVSVSYDGVVLHHVPVL